MKRLLGVLAAFGLLLLPASPARAVNSLVFTVVVDCDDTDGSSTAEPLGVVMPAGTYAVSITGACFLAYPGLDGCHLLAVAYTGGCGQPLTALSCGAFHVQVDGQCPAFGGAGTIYHGNNGPVTAKVADCCHSDNEGYFVVTLTWLP